MSVTVAFYSLSTLSNAVLQAIGKVTIPVKNALTALIVQTIVLVLLLIFTELNLYCLAIATITYSLLMCILNAKDVLKYLEYKDNVKQIFVLPAISAAVMGVAAFVTYTLASRVTGNVISLIASVVIGVMIYGVLILKLHVISEEEMLEMPKGASINRLVKKLRL